MSGPPSTTVSARGLGRELRELRLAADLSLRKVGELLDWQASKISRMETGTYGTKPEDVASLLAIYGVTGRERSRCRSSRSPMATTLG